MAASQISSLLSLETTLAITTLSKSSIYELMARGDFPVPVKVSARRVAWRVQDISCWLDSRAASTATSEPRAERSEAQTLHAVKALFEIIEAHGGGTPRVRAFIDMISSKMPESAE